MEIVALNPSLEPLFWEHVNQDIPHYYFFAHDWKYCRSETQILLALGEKGRISGMMLIFGNRIVQLRGTRQSGRALLDRLGLEKVELQAPEQHKQCVLAKYEPTWSHELMLMVLRKGQERLQENHRVVKLEVSDSRQIAAIVNSCFGQEADGISISSQEQERTIPRVEVTPEQIAEQMNSTTWAGIKENEELVSIGRMRLTGEVGHVPTVATHEAHRNKGYAASIVSYLVGQILEKMPIVIIYTLGGNAPAIKVYSRVGFTPYRKYFLMKGYRR